MNTVNETFATVSMTLTSVALAAFLYVQMGRAFMPPLV
jgi:hypothetical protein